MHLSKESQSPILKQIVEMLNSVAERASDIDLDRTMIPGFDSTDQDSMAANLFFQVVGIYEVRLDSFHF